MYFKWNTLKNKQLTTDSMVDTAAEFTNGY